MPPPRLPVLLLGLALLAPAARADTVRLLPGDRDAAQARVDLIRQAEREILVEYFIVGRDDLSMAVLTLLRDAARRGVQVRLILDAQWNGIPHAVQAHLVREGIAIREYHPFRPWKPGWWTRRLHDKLLVVDGREMVTGGRNIQAPYFGQGEEIARRNYLDLDVHVDGETAARAREYFLTLWNSREVRKTHLSRFRRKWLEMPCERLTDRQQRARCEDSRARARAELAAAGVLLDEHRRQLEEHDLVDLRGARDWSEGGREVGEVRFLHDPAGKKQKGAGIGKDLLDLLDAAGERVTIESPYLVPSKAFRKSLRRATARGVSVRILTNSLAVTDNLFPQAGYARWKDELVEWGVELWEYAGPECLHSKAAVFDERMTVVGSFNLDPRSEHLNTEVAVVADDPALASETRALMDAHLARAVRIGPGGRPLPGPVSLPQVSCAKKAKLGLLRLVAPLIHKQL